MKQPCKTCQKVRAVLRRAVTAPRERLVDIVNRKRKPKGERPAR